VTRRRWSSLCFLFSLLLGGCAPAHAGNTGVEHWLLEPGTTVALAEDHRVPLVQLVIEFPVGAWSSWAGTEHAREAFELQIFDPTGSLRAGADRIGARLALVVDDRSSRLEASCLKSEIEPLLSLVRDVLQNREFDRREAAAWKHRREFEFKASQKQPFFVAGQTVARLLFASGDSRRRAWERPDPVETDWKRLAATRDVTVRLPGRVIGFAGDLTREEAGRLAVSLLPPLLEGAVPDIAPELLPLVPREDRKDTTVHLPRLTQAYFAYGRESVSFTDPSFPAFVVADHVLGGHFYSRLYSALRHEGGETYGARSTNLGDVAIGPYGLGTFTRAANAPATESKLREVLRAFHAQGITEEERADAIGNLRGRILFERQSPATILEAWLLEQRLGLPEGFRDELPERAGALSLDEINRFIVRYYDPAQFTMVRVVPEK
jgi:zinc protease